MSTLRDPRAANETREDGTRASPTKTALRRESEGIVVRRVLTLFSAGRQLFYALAVSKTVLYLIHTCIYITTSINKMNYTRKSESWALHCPPPPP